MLTICKETIDFVRACEAIHALLERKHMLTSEDRYLIEFNANELRDRLTPN
jgi:hypothetical protein